MHLSKRLLYLCIIGYSAALLIFQDWPMMASTTGIYQSGPWLLKMAVDLLFVCMAGIRLIGPALFSEEDDEDDVGLHEEDLHFSDTALFGLFLLNLVGNGGLHVYQALYTQGAESIYYSIWVMAEGVGIFFSYVLWTHAAKAQRKLARQQREQAAQRPRSVA